MVEASCHCGAIKLEVPNAPEKVTSCNCTICRRLGTLWAYYSPAQVRVTGETATYIWGDKSIAFHHCRICGCTTHWSPLDPKGEHMGVNSRLMDPAIVAAARTRFVNGFDDTWTEQAE